ncbi:DsbE family thiol:disulfide interchange protein [Salinarimonas ramus]|uniref:Thiol:disulfide interchange protein CycY n=1 Tax=Salinarimonas ramus TaxID=690164 RepID=A0A917Q3T4_9HYPH|nr:DsbE family thiol:disulfide interchange protein [Salinarimonas ramus]GGK17431.1 thiol:disulfide interchange protein CycY [Salinarimonas ramus]
MDERPHHPPEATSPDAADPAPRAKVRVLFLLPVLIFAGLAIVFLIGLFGDPSRVPSVLIGRAAPEVSLPPLEGLTEAGMQIPGFATADLAGTPEAPVTIVNVWASWCGPCRVEHPVLMELATLPYLNIVGINYKDAPENARRFLGALGNPYDRVGVDENGRSAIEWGVYGVPETFVVDSEGVIRYKHIGPIEPHQIETFLDAVRAALPEDMRARLPTG